MAMVFAVAAPTDALRAQRDAERFRVAIGLLRRDLHDEAAKQFERFLRASPRHELAREAWYRLGTCRQTLGKPDAAIEAFTSALQSDGELDYIPECRYRLGKVLQARKKKKAAVQQFASLASEQEETHYLYVPAQYARGECLRDLGDKEQALAAFRDAARLDKDAKGKYGMPALYYAGFLLLDLDRFDEAAKAFASAIDRYSEHEARPECEFLLGEALYRGGDFERALTAYRAAVESGGAHADDAQFGIGWAYVKSNDLANATTAFQAVAKRWGDSPLAAKAELEAGRLLYKRREFDAARAQLSSLLERGDLAPELRVAGLELAGLAALDGGKADAAIERFRAALGAEPDAATRGRLSYNLGESLAEVADFKNAVAAYSEAEKHATAPELLGDAQYGLCLALHRLRDYRGSIAKAKALVDANPDHRLATTARFALAENYFALKDYRTADQFYGQVGSEDALARKAAFKRAWCAYLGGDRSLAAERFAALSGGEGREDSSVAEEALSMSALSWLQANDGDKALRAADTYKARYPKGTYLARTERVAAQVLQDRGDLPGAARRVANAASAEGTGERALEDKLQLAEIQFKQGDFKSARESYTAVRDADGKVGAQALRGLAWCAFELGDDDDCVTSIRAALEHPAAKDASPAMLELLSSLHHRAKRWDEAAKAAEQFLGDHPDHPRAAEMRYALGVAYARSDKLEEARKAFAGLGDMSALARPDRGYYEMAWVCRRSKLEKEALTAFAMVAQTSQDADLAGEANLHVGQAALEAKQVDAARELFAKVKGKYEAQALYRTGFSWLDADEPKKAYPFFESIVELGAKRTGLFDEALFLSGESLFLAGDHENASPRLQSFLDRAPDHERAQRARLHLGECSVLLGSSDAAVQQLEEFIRRGADEIKSDRARAQLWLGRARLARKEHDRAEAAFAAATDLSDGPIGAEAQFRRGENRKAQGDLKSAVDEFIKLSILFTHAEWVQRGLLEAGTCYQKLEKPKKAKKFLQELIERFPDCPASREARALLKRINQG